MTLFFRAVLGSHQNWEEGTEISHFPSAPHMHILPIINISFHSGTFVMMDEPTLDRTLSPKVWSLQGTLSVLQILCI